MYVSSPAGQDGGLKGGSSEALTGPAWGLLDSMADRKLMIEVSEVLLLESSAPDSKKRKTEITTEKGNEINSTLCSSWALKGLVNANCKKI